MKPRKLVITMEIETDMPVKQLRCPSRWRFYQDGGRFLNITQISPPNVIQPVQASKRKRDR